MSVNGKTSAERELSFSVPQGTSADATIFNAYTCTLGREIPDTLSMIGFTDDHVVNKSFRAKSHEEDEETITVIEDCMKSVKLWMVPVQLKMNSEKTEIIYFVKQEQISKCAATSLDVNGMKIPRSDIIQYLEAWLDASLAMKNHTKEKCATAMIHFLKIKHIRPLFTKGTCQSLILGLCISHLDYTNLIIFVLPDTQINKFQHIQNMCTKLVLNWGKFDSTYQALRILHWLLVNSRTVFKLLLITFKCINNLAPEHLKNLLVRPPLGHALRSTSDDLCLIVPFTKLKHS